MVEGDMQSVTGKNLKLIESETLLDPSLVPQRTVKLKMIDKMPPIPERDRWRLGYLEKRLTARGDAYYAGQDTEDLTSLIDSLCTG